MSGYDARGLKESFYCPNCKKLVWHGYEWIKLSETRYYSTCPNCHTELTATVESKPMIITIEYEKPQPK